jgi:hypothetical protein
LKIYFMRLLLPFDDSTKIYDLIYIDLTSLVAQSHFQNVLSPGKCQASTVPCRVARPDFGSIILRQSTLSPAEDIRSKLVTYLCSNTMLYLQVKCLQLLKLNNKCQEFLSLKRQMIDITTIIYAESRPHQNLFPYLNLSSRCSKNSMRVMFNLSIIII